MIHSTGQSPIGDNSPPISPEHSGDFTLNPKDTSTHSESKSKEKPAKDIDLLNSPSLSPLSDDDQFPVKKKASIKPRKKAKKRVAGLSEEKAQQALNAIVKCVKQALRTHK